MTEEQKANNQESKPSSYSDEQTPVDENIRKTGETGDTDAKSTATPEAPGEDFVAGSPNQGTESR
ncbi:hypothetical protein [Nostoc sp. UHCC 0252]|uniref:hypothetical protein n=1 Tax=Nostoc sp. UHCC 0252 TaxID=3110241 RepID=UPI002B216C38|nr:hypothetical protein [Nostoc sp. UHCC 0252]MEA5601479.1 hypothetical protein [Nostoc sp. UHCC 0252]